MTRSELIAQTQDSDLLGCLPVELAIEIIELVRMDPAFHPHQRTNICFAFAHVCRRWRHILLGNPQFWTEVTFDLDVPDDKDAALVLPGRAERFRLGMRSSGNLPVAAYIASDSRFCNTAPPELLSSIKVIKSALSRIHTLELVIPASHLKHFVNVPAPTLRHFTLEIMEEFEDIYTEYGMVRNLKRLTSTAETMRLRIWSTLRIEVSWSQLVEVELQMLSLVHLLEALRHAPNVVKVLAKVVSVEPIEAWEHVLVHKGLQDLTLSFCFEDGTSTHAGNFFERVTLPNLHSLTFPTPQAVRPAIFLEFLERSRCPLEKVELNEPASLDQLRNILRLLPLLKELRLATMREESIADVFDTVFGIDSFGAKVEGLPCIRNFRYTGDWRTTSPSWKFLERCFTFNLALQHLNLTVLVNIEDVPRMPSVWMDEEEVEAIRRLRAQGKEIRLEVWARGNYFGDFAEASLTRPTLR